MISDSFLGKDLTQEEVEEMMVEMEMEGLVYKTWNDELQDYLWKSTPLGRKEKNLRSYR